MTAKTAHAKGIPWRVASYSRLSRDDGDSNGVSNSIANQKSIISNFIDQQDDMLLVQEFADDGKTGSNFERDGFIAMMEAVDKGLVNCIAVKDFSRFGRNYLEVGRYIQEIYPTLGIRFVAINDDYDSIREQGYTDALIVPFKNLINDNYCATTSVKVKAHLDIKRKRGEYVSNFAPYGYLKDPADKRHLIVDDEAATVVKMMFDWRIDGMNANNIAAKLNELGIPSPHELKESRDCKQHAHFKRGLRCKWHAKEVIRILSNETYTGSTVQGKTFKPSFRSKAIVQKSPEEWTVVRDMHEPIVDERSFRMVAELMARDTRTPPGKDKLALLSGFVFCDDCGDTLCRHTNTVKGKKYGYYCCSTYRKDCTSCTSHSIRDVELLAIVSQSVLAAIAHMLSTKDVWVNTSQATAASKKTELLAKRWQAADAEIRRCRSMGHRIYDDYSKGLISKDELIEYKEAYAQQASDCEAQIQLIEEEREAHAAANDASAWEKTFESWRNATEIDRRMLAELVDGVYVSAERNVRIKFKFSDLMTSESEVM